ncbi:MAG: hypothetical protein LBI68_01200, partial [Azoarcus sp.]|nr:hypothetical protein [Azoarcus sp.]
MKYETLCERLIAATLFALCAPVIFFSGIGTAQAQGMPFYGYGYGYGGYYYQRAVPPARVPAVPAPVVPLPVAPVPVVPVPVVPVPVASSGNYVIEYRDANDALFLAVQINTRLGFASISSIYTGFLDPYLSGAVNYAYVKFVDGNGVIRGNLRGVNGGPVVDRAECMFITSGLGAVTNVRVCPALRPGDIVLIGHHHPNKLRIYDATTGVQLPVSATVRYQISPTGELVLRL